MLTLTRSEAAALLSTVASALYGTEGVPTAEGVIRAGEVFRVVVKAPTDRDAAFLHLILSEDYSDAEKLDQIFKAITD